MKPYIICATDFEPEAFKALQYSCMLAGQLQCSVTLLHVQTIGLLIGAAIGTTSNFQERFKEQIKRVHIYYPDIHVTTASITGDVIEGINDFIDESGMPIMVIVGNKYNATYNLVPEGHLNKMLRRIKAPVISVPYLSDMVKISRIAYAFDNIYSGSAKALEWLQKFCSEQDIELHMLIGWNDAISYDNTPSMHPQAVEALEGVKYQLHFFKQNNLTDNLVQFVHSNHFDILCVMPRTYNVIKTVYHQSLTKHFLMNIHLPLLALHEED